MDALSLVVSVFVVLVALVTAFISYMNLKAITTFTLYLTAETKDGVIDQNNYYYYPDRIKSTVLNNGITIPPPYSMSIRWFDLHLGNTGPGIARVNSWTVDYKSNNNQDSSDMKSKFELYLGPQSELVIVGYLPRDISMMRAGTIPVMYSQFGKLPNSYGRFPWDVDVVYSKKVILPSRKRYTLKFKIASNGSVEREGPFLIK